MEAGNEAPKPIRLFYSYSHKDERYREKLETQLKILQRQGVIEAWHDRKIGAGKEWAAEIDHHLETAGIILLFAKLQALPRDGKAITRWNNRAEAYKSVAVGIREAAKELHTPPHPTPLPEREGAKRGAASPPPSPAPRERAGVRALKDFEVFRDIDAPWCPEMVARCS